MGILLLPIAIGFYFLPSIVSLLRSSNKTPTIVIVNLFLGWTIAGWIVALFAAFLSETKEQARLREMAYRHMAAMSVPPADPASPGNAPPAGHALGRTVEHFPEDRSNPPSIA